MHSLHCRTALTLTLAELLNKTKNCNCLIHCSKDKTSYFHLQSYMHIQELFKNYYSSTFFLPFLTMDFVFDSQHKQSS